MGADKPMVKNGRSGATWSLHADGCSCCNSPASRRRAKRPAKRREQRTWRKDAAA
jgi:hypothetical protein